MSIFDTLFGKLKAVLHVIAQDVRDVGEKIVDHVEDVKEHIAQHFDIPAGEVAGRLDEKAANDPQKLKWRTSIVDLLKLLDMDSSKAARRQLATEFNPDMGREFDGLPEQNVWLHKQVMTEIAKRGIPIPQPAD
jgi:hypothetical protein